MQYGEFEVIIAFVYKAAESHVNDKFAQYRALQSQSMLDSLSPNRCKHMLRSRLIATLTEGLRNNVPHNLKLITFQLDEPELLMPLIHSVKSENSQVNIMQILITKSLYTDMAKKLVMMHSNWRVPITEHGHDLVYGYG